MDSQRILQEGELVQWYRVEQILGRGGFGVTYLATDTNLDHRVAIKEYMPALDVERLADNSIVPVDESFRHDFDNGVGNFLREARTLVKFRHPNIVRVMTVFEANNTAYLVMEYEEGEEFKSCVQRGACQDENTLKSLFLRIVDGLDQVHQYGFLHRDIKPVNLIIRNDGTPVLLDFGAARSTDGDAGAHTAYVSAGYTPIEQYQEGQNFEVGPWTDIYSLGATLYYAISGETPVGPTGRLAAMIRKTPDPLRSASEAGAGRYSQPFLDAIDWALSFKPADRPQNLSQWRDALSGEEAGDQAGDQVSARADDRGLAPELNQNPKKDSKLLIEKPARPSRRPAEKPRSVSSVGLWVAAALSLAVVSGAGAKMYQTYDSRKAIARLLDRADLRFESADYVDGAVPLYREVLAAKPDHPKAQLKLSQIEEIFVRRVDTQIRTAEFAQADRSIEEFKKIASDNKITDELLERLRLARDAQAIEGRFEQAQAHNDAGEHQRALALVRSLRNERPEDSRLATIESVANRGLNEFAAREELLVQQREEQEKKKIASAKRIADANRRQRERREQYNRYLGYAEGAVSEGDVVTARNWLDDARSLQIEDARLNSLESQVAAQEAYERRPLTDYEVSYATSQFNELVRAVESKNQAEIKSLTEGQSSRQNLFDTLFARYTRIDVKVIDIKSSLDPKRVTAKLRIESMYLPNGDIVYPSPAYRDSEVKLNRQRYSWSNIVW